MKSKTKNIIRSGLIILILITIFFVSWLLLSQQNILNSDRYKSYLGIFISYIVVLVMLLNVYDSFSFGKRKIVDNIYSYSISCVFAAFFFYFLDTLAFRYFYRILYIVVAVVIQIIFAILCCFYFDKKYYKTIVPKKTIILYDDDYILERIYSIHHFLEKYNVVLKTKTHERKEIFDLLDSNDVIFVSTSDATLRNDILVQCLIKNKEAFVFPHEGDVILSGSDYAYESYIPMLNVARPTPLYIYLFIKRIFDIVFSFLALIILSPFMLIVAIAIHFYDNGPVFYSHQRLTKNGKLFKIYKFRSMKVNAEADGVARLVSENDDRITPIGKFIRSIRFDELPQLINILMGDMSFVGPRPERPEIANEYSKTYSPFNLRLQVKAGLTGFAQVYGKYNTVPEEKLKMDLYYINNMSLVLDLKLILLTFRTIFIKESTESVASNKTTAKK